MPYIVSPFRAAGLAALSLSLIGCGSFRKAVDSIGKWTADPITVPYAAEVDLLVLLSPNDQPTPTGDTPTTGATYGQRVEKALAAAEDHAEPKYTQLRRTVIEALVRRSNSLCHTYKLDLVRRQARGNFLFGTSALLLGTTGAVVTHAATARALSGAAAISTGTQSELNQDYYFEKTATVLSKAIDKRREVQLKLIQANLGVSKANYTIRGAVMDAEEYHATCSLTGAVAELEKAVDRIDVLQSVDAAASAASAYTAIRQRLNASQPAASAAQ